MSPFYPEVECSFAPLRPEVVPENCACVLCVARRGLVRAVSESWESIPYVCPACRQGDSYFGKAVFSWEPLPVFCPNHRAQVALLPLRLPTRPRRTTETAL